MQLQRMAVAAVRRVRLEVGDEAEEVHVDGEEMEGMETREGKGPLREGGGGLMLTTLGWDRAGSDY